MLDLPPSARPDRHRRARRRAGHTAPRVGSGRIAVLATPVMINLIEAAALAAVEHLLPAGHQSLGIHLDVRHFAATPVGLRVTATAEVTAVEGRTISFRVEARDEREPIGDGTHQRVVVNVARFDERVQRKLAAPDRMRAAAEAAASVMLCRSSWRSSPRSPCRCRVRALCGRSSAP